MNLEIGSKTKVEVDEIKNLEAKLKKLDMKNEKLKLQLMKLKVEVDKHSKGEKIVMWGENWNVCFISFLDCKVKKTRGLVYCRKLTALAPGQKIFVEFDDDGNPIGKNATSYAYFLGEKVRNRTIFPVQVTGWEDFKAKTLDHLWSCVLEVCDFDNPELRREEVMKHARKLFKGSRYKLKQKYIDIPKLTTKDDQLKNKPDDMLKADWKYLVGLWRSPKFQEKSNKAKESRNKRKKEREEGLNKKTDDQILMEVLGPDTHGYLRCYGRGKSITQHFGVKPSRMELVKEVVEVRRTTEDVIEQAKNEVLKSRQEVADIRKEAAATKKEVEAKVDEKIAANNEMWQKKIDSC
ncbi:hypothetical protein KSS87_021985 [Heliosperma pusillum]|nr:hypothetical protein KSS87_021985 [Heliosperma pusillum]